MGVEISKVYLAKEEAIETNDEVECYVEVKNDFQKDRVIDVKLYLSHGWRCGRPPLIKPPWKGTVSINPSEIDVGSIEARQKKKAYFTITTTNAVYHPYNLIHFRVSYSVPAEKTRTKVIHIRKD